MLSFVGRPGYGTVPYPSTRGSSSALTSSCPRSCLCLQNIPSLVRCHLSLHPAELVMSHCSVGCCFLRSLCWPASLLGPGQARRSQAAARAGWESLPHTAPSSCPSATACVAPRLCASSCGYVHFGLSIQACGEGGFVVLQTAFPGAAGARAALA